MKDNSYCEVIKYLSCFVCALSEAKGMIKFMRIGIDIGGMTVKIGLVEEEIYRITDKKVIPTDSEKQSAEALVGRIVMVIQELLGENNIALTECKAIGIVEWWIVGWERCYIPIIWAGKISHSLTCWNRRYRFQWRLQMMLTPPLWARKREAVDYKKAAVWDGKTWLIF